MRPFSSLAFGHYDGVSILWSHYIETDQIMDEGAIGFEQLENDYYLDSCF